jgi:hypothetical protein
VKVNAGTYQSQDWLSLEERMKRQNGIKTYKTYTTNDIEFLPKSL